VKFTGKIALRHEVFIELSQTNLKNGKSTEVDSVRKFQGGGSEKDYGTAKLEINSSF